MLGDEREGTVMSIAGLIMMLALTPADATPLTFVHGDEQIVSWIDRGSIRRTGDRVRARVLRIRHPDQAFWVVQEIDCAAGTWALVGIKNVTTTDDVPPSLDGEARHQPITRDDRSEHALRNATCDGDFRQTAIRPARGAAAAIARLAETKATAVRERPLELIVVRAGASPVLMDRATLEGGGPQWEVRSLKSTSGRGVWSGWLLDCDRTDLAVDLQWTAPMAGAGYGAVRQDRNYGGVAAADEDQAALVRAACDPEVWDRPVHASVDAAIRAARTNGR